MSNSTILYFYIILVESLVVLGGVGSIVTHGQEYKEVRHTLCISYNTANWDHYNLFIMECVYLCRPGHVIKWPVTLG